MRCRHTGIRNSNACRRRLKRPLRIWTLNSKQPKRSGLMRKEDCQGWRVAKGQCPRKPARGRLLQRKQLNTAEIQITSRHQLPWVCILTYLISIFQAERFLVITRKNLISYPRTSIFPPGTTLPISVKISPRLPSALISSLVDSSTETSSPPLVCGSKSSICINSGIWSKSTCGL